MEQGKFEADPIVDDDEDLPIKTQAEIISALHLVKGEIAIVESAMVQKVKALEAEARSLEKLTARKRWLESQLPPPQEVEDNPAEAI